MKHFSKNRLLIIIGLLINKFDKLLQGKLQNVIYYRQLSRIQDSKNKIPGRDNLFKIAINKVDQITSKSITIK